MIYKTTKNMSKEDLIAYVKELEEENKRLENDVEYYIDESNSLYDLYKEKELKLEKDKEKLINSEDILDYIRFKYFSEIGRHATDVINEYLRWK